VGYLSKEKIQEFRGEIVEFEAPELGGSLPLRAIGFKDLMAVQEIEDDVERAVEFIRIGIVDTESGGPMFGADEFPGVVNYWTNALIKRVADKLGELSGADIKTAEELEGNSDETLKGGSPTS
jgi:hypothetical protein